ncbi:MAG: alpha/beta hydrolase, partial [Myxococcales bacterium]|nr:alpha/beta hydrolase [Myxococcales bacterium]
WKRRGDTGPVLVLVDGAMGHRGFGPMPAVADHLADAFRVVLYDRRGRGDSGDTAPFHRDREVEDLAAVVEAQGEQVALFGISSGAMLALRGAAAIPAIQQVVVFEPPMYLDGTFEPDPPDFRERIDTLLAAGDRDGAVSLFMRVVGVPRFGVAMMRWMWWVWPKLCATAHTLPYDFAQLGDTHRGGPLPEEIGDVLGSVGVPAHVLVGGASPAYMEHAAEVVAGRVAGARLTTIPGATHTAGAGTLGPFVRRALGGEP